MNKLIAIFFLTPYLFSTTVLGQLVKLPAFVNHFKEHKTQNKDLTIWQFLCIHYAHGNVKDADYEEDMKLPFKTHLNCFIQTNVVVPPTFLIICTKHTYTNTKKDIYILTNDNTTASYLSSIWQPPKYC